MKGVKKSPYPFGLKENMEGGNRAKKLALFILSYDNNSTYLYNGSHYRLPGCNDLCGLSVLQEQQ